MFRRLLALSVLTANTLVAQAYVYPSLQTPVIVDREYNFAAASGAGTSVIVQWREGVAQSLQTGVEAGLASPKGGGDARLLVGGSLAFQLSRSTDDFPFDVALTLGAGLSLGGDTSIVRIPFGAVVGHTFELDGGYKLTPYAHPRLSIDHCGACAGSSSKVSVDVDLGLDFVVTPQISLRTALLFSGADYSGGTNAVGFSLAWTPRGLKK
jgi:hypothetical protein